MELQRKRTALVVEDDPFLLRGMSYLLSREGFEVTGAKDGQEAIDICKERRFSVIVCDFNMPHKKGDAVFESLTEEQKKRFLLWSGSGVDATKSFKEPVSAMAKDAPSDEVLERVMLLVNGEAP